MLGFFIFFFLLFIPVAIVVGYFLALKDSTAKPQQCPACSRDIRMAGSKLKCPKCGTKLSRDNEGQFFITPN